MATGRDEAVGGRPWWTIPVSNYTCNCKSNLLRPTAMTVAIHCIINGFQFHFCLSLLAGSQKNEWHSLNYSHLCKNKVLNLWTQGKSLIVIYFSISMYIYGHDSSAAFLFVWMSILVPITCYDSLHWYQSLKLASLTKDLVYCMILLNFDFWNMCCFLNRIVPYCRKFCADRFSVLDRQKRT